MTEKADKRPVVECPYPGCGASIPVAQTMSAGDYLCRCHACTLRLGWATYVSGERKPYVTVVEKEKAA